MESGYQQMFVASDKEEAVPSKILEYSLDVLIRYKNSSFVQLFIVVSSVCGVVPTWCRLYTPSDCRHHS